MSVSPSSRAVKIFFSYATTAPKDKKLLAKLTTHLMTLKRIHLIDEWYDSAISAGGEINRIIQNRLDAVDIIVLLISPEFLASKRCYDLEMQHALALNKIKATRLIPVILTPIDLEHTPLDQYSPLPPDGTPISNYRNIENALNEVAKGIRKVVEEIVHHVGFRSSAPLPPIHTFCNVPYRENIFFTDREQILDAIHSTLQAQPSLQTRIITLQGLGGIGKTQIALSYVYRYAAHYHYLLWLHAPSYSQFSLEVAILVDQLAIPHGQHCEAQEIFAAFKDWLQKQSDWLLVVDAINDASLLDLILPINSAGHVLLTTRLQSLEIQTHTFLVTHMETEDSVSFLLHRAGMLSTQASARLQVPAITLLAATSLVQRMGGFPLALEQAGAYVEETGCGLTTYLQLYEQYGKRIKLLERRGGRAAIHPDSTVTTLTVTIDAIKEKSIAHLALLHLLAFMQPDEIPVQLLEQGSKQVKPPLQGILGDPLRLYEMLADLHTHSAIAYRVNSMTMTMHPILQDILISTLTPRQRYQWAEQVVAVVDNFFPEGNFESWAECECAFKQAQHCSNLIETYQIKSVAALRLLQHLGFYCFLRAYNTAAEQYLKQALHLATQLQQSASLAAAQTLNTLGRLRQRQARYREAEHLYQQALTIREQLLDPFHALVAESVHNLAALYGDQGQYQQAEQFYQRVLTIDKHNEAISGTTSLETAQTLNNLGLIYLMQGNLAKAEERYQQAHARYIQSLAGKPDVPDHAYTLIGLGNICEQREDYQQALQLYQQALSLRQATLGNTHYETAYALTKLASIYEEQGAYQDAERHYQQALQIIKETFGEDHPDFALIMNDLAFLADTQKQYDKAEKLYRRALHAYEQASGPQHPFVASVLNNLGLLYLAQGKEGDAEPYLQRALTIRTQELGPTHLHTAQSMHNLARLYLQKKKYQDAERLLQQAFTIYVTALGPEHRKTREVQKMQATLATLIEQQANDTDA